MEDVPPLPLNLPLVLVKPKEECSTAEVYKVSYTRYAFEIQLSLPLVLVICKCMHMLVFVYSFECGA